MNIPITHQFAEEPPPVELQNVEARRHCSGGRAVADHPVVRDAVAEGSSTWKGLPAHDHL